MENTMEIVQSAWSTNHPMPIPQMIHFLFIPCPEYLTTYVPAIVRKSIPSAPCTITARPSVPPYLWQLASPSRWLHLLPCVRRDGEVDPIDGTTGTGFLVGSSAVPIALSHPATHTC